MVRKRMKPSKKKKPPATPSQPNVNGGQQKEEEEEDDEERQEEDFSNGAQKSFNGAFSLLALHQDEMTTNTNTTSSSSSSEMASTSCSETCFDSNSNGDDPSTSSTTSSSELFWESDLIPMQLYGGNKGFGGGNKQKKVVASAGTVASVIDKGYVRNSPGGGGKRWNSVKLKGIYNNKAANNDEAEQFLYAMLGDDCELSMAVVRDVLCQCGYDVEKALDVLLDLSGSSHNQYMSRSYIEFDDSGDDEIAKCQLPDWMLHSTLDLSEKEVHQFLRASGYDYSDYREALVGPKKQTRPAITEQNLPQTVLESLFHIPKSSEHEPDSMDWKNVVKKMESFGPGLDSCAYGVTQLQQNTEHAKGEDYMLFRKSANQHYDAMKSCYQKAATAYSSGQRSYAAILSDQGKVHNKIARQADEKASHDIFTARNKEIQNTVTIDLHGQHVKQAIKLLKVHLLLFTTYVHSVQVLRVITGCGTHGVGKGKLKLSVISLLQKAGFEWSEENRGTLLIKLEGGRNFNFVESEDESEYLQFPKPKM